MHIVYISRQKFLPCSSNWVNALFVTPWCQVHRTLVILVGTRHWSWKRSHHLLYPAAYTRFLVAISMSCNSVALCLGKVVEFVFNLDESGPADCEDCKEKKSSLLRRSARKMDLTLWYHTSGLYLCGGWHHDAIDYSSVWKSGHIRNSGPPKESDNDYVALTS
jgi:hypothetical protein